MKKEKILSILISFYFVLIVLTDFCYKYSIVNNLDSFKFSFSLKLIIGFSMLSFSFFSLKFVDYKRTILIISLLVIASVVSVISMDQNARYASLYIQGQYFFGVIVMFFFFSFYKNICSKYLVLTLEVILWINLLLIVIGFYYEIPLFKTYIKGVRFGYSGFFKSTSVATYFYMFNFILFFLKKKTRYNYFLLLNVIIALLFIGSKSSYLFLFIVFLFLMLKALFNAGRIKNIKWFLGFFVSISIAIGILIFKLIFTFNPVLKDVLQTHGVVTAFFSYRDRLVVDVSIIVKEKYNLMNYLFGGISHVPRLTEVAIVDMVITFGIIGSGLFGWFLIHKFPRIINLEVRFLLGIICVIIMLRGNFFYFPSVIYMSIAIFALIAKTVESNRLNLKIL